MTRTIKTVMPLVVVLAFGGTDRVTRSPAPARDYASLPLHFATDRTSQASDVTFAARGPGYGVFLRATDMVLTLSPPLASGHSRDTWDAAAWGATATAVRMTFVGANATPAMSGVDELPGKAHSIVGRDASAWRTNLPTYATVAYRGLYPGIDLEVYGNQQRLEYDFVVAARRDPRQIAVRVDGVAPLAVTADGDLLLRTKAVEIRQPKPLIYQQVGASRRIVDGGYALRGPHEVGFAIGAYDTSRPLVIDPVLAYSTCWF
jgi:hypothetical protein